jgi:ankyrin repeat protein
MTPMLCAMSGDNEQLVRERSIIITMLIKASGDSVPTWRNEDGDTYLHIAAANMQIEYCRTLIERGTVLELNLLDSSHLRNLLLLFRFLC